MSRGSAHAALGSLLIDGVGAGDATPARRCAERLAPAFGRVSALLQRVEPPLLAVGALVDPLAGSALQDTPAPAPAPGHAVVGGAQRARRVAPPAQRPRLALDAARRSALRPASAGQPAVRAALATRPRLAAAQSGAPRPHPHPHPHPHGEQDRARRSTLTPPVAANRRRSAAGAAVVDRAGIGTVPPAAPAGGLGGGVRGPSLALHAASPTAAKTAHLTLAETLERLTASARAGAAPAPPPPARSAAAWPPRAGARSSAGAPTRAAIAQAVGRATRDPAASLATRRPIGAMSSSTAALPGEPGPGRGRTRGPGASATATATATATLRATIERACAHATSARPARSEAHPAGGSAPPQPAATPVHPALMDRLARTLEGLEGVHDRLSDLSPDPPAPVRWLEDDDELAGRLQRLLTRQAQARGIDLS